MLRCLEGPASASSAASSREAGGTGGILGNWRLGCCRRPTRFNGKNHEPEGGTKSRVTSNHFTEFSLFQLIQIQQNMNILAPCTLNLGEPQGICKWQDAHWDQMTWGQWDLWTIPKPQKESFGVPVDIGKPCEVCCHTQPVGGEDLLLLPEELVGAHPQLHAKIGQQVRDWWSNCNGSRNKPWLCTKTEHWDHFEPTVYESLDELIEWKIQHTDYEIGYSEDWGPRSSLYHEWLQANWGTDQTQWLGFRCDKSDATPTQQQLGTC